MYTKVLGKPTGFSATHYICKNPHGHTIQKILQLTLTAVRATNLNITVKYIS